MHDASVFTGPWPFATGEHESLPALVTILQKVGITAAAVSPARAILAPEPEAHNAALAQALDDLGGVPVAFVPVPVIDPSSPIWRDHLATCRALFGDALRAVKIVPNYQSVDLHDPCAVALAHELARQGLTLCIQMRMADERAHHPLMKVLGVEPAAILALAARAPELPILACGPYLAELPALAPAPNIHAELSFVESGFLLRGALAALGSDRLLLGTHAPLHYPAAGVAKLTSDELSPDDLARIGRANFARLFGPVEEKERSSDD
jgi:predicted TIM-barrel fold metal-dependent hydrolase